MNQEVIFTVGLPGSGKSTWAKPFVEQHPNYIRISRDDLRNMRGKYFIPKQEDLITDMQYACMTAALKRGFSLVIDTTGFEDKYINKMKSLCLEINSNIQFKTKLFTDVSVEECIKRDAKRPSPVGKEVIMKFYDKYLRDKVKVIHGDRSAVICDLDGTLAIHNGRSPYDEERCDEDLVNEKVRNILWQTTGLHSHLIFVSGRHDTVKEKTEKWIKEKGCPGRTFDLFMRKAGDNRPDNIIKKEIFMEHINGKFRVEFVLDDRNRVVDMWRNDLGLTCLQVAEGDF